MVTTNFQSTNWLKFLLGNWLFSPNAYLTFRINFCWENFRISVKAFQAFKSKNRVAIMLSKRKWTLCRAIIRSNYSLNKNLINLDKLDIAFDDICSILITMASWVKSFSIMASSNIDETSERWELRLSSCPSSLKFWVHISPHKSNHFVWSLSR